MFKFIKFAVYFIRIASLENSVDDAISKCSTLKKRVTDHVLLRDLEDIEDRLVRAKCIIPCINNRGKNIFMFNEEKVL